MKTILIKQPAGFGDIMFCLKIAKHYIDKGLKVIWPVIPEYVYIKEYVHIDGLEFCSTNDIFPYRDLYESTSLDIIEGDDVIFIPLQSAWNK